MHSSWSASSGVRPINAAFIVLALVVFLHVLVLFSWHKPHTQRVIPVTDMAVSFKLSSRVNPENVIVQHKILPVSEILPEKTPQQPAQIEQQTDVNTSPATTSSVNVIKDSEPVYKASYLNNQSPAYPLAARRMGLQGRVVLQVEVLADGRCGGIAIQTSSGYAMLDDAALEAVKSWRFVPARQAGNAIDKWFIIPVQFSLKDNA